MKPRSLMGYISVLGISAIVAQVPQATRLPLPFLDGASQTNFLFSLSDLEHPVVCPLRYTNVLSNTNLFSRSQQRLLAALSSKYVGVTTNSGPPGSVLTGLIEATFNHGRDRGIIAHFVYPSSGDEEKVVFLGNRQKIGKWQAASGRGYYVNVIDNRLCDYQEFEAGKLNGLFTQFYKERCVLWLQFTNGKAIGKLLMWTQRTSDTRQGDVCDGLAVEADMKEPYDFLRYQDGRFDLTWIDSPRTLTNSTGSASSGRSQD